MHREVLRRWSLNTVAVDKKLGAELLVQLLVEVLDKSQGEL